MHASSVTSHHKQWPLTPLGYSISQRHVLDFTWLATTNSIVHVFQMHPLIGGSWYGGRWGVGSRWAIQHGPQRGEHTFSARHERVTGHRMFNSSNLLPHFLLVHLTLSLAFPKMVIYLTSANSSAWWRYQLRLETRFKWTTVSGWSWTLDSSGRGTLNQARLYRLYK